jgi:curved DNA-binding protein CbpA
VPPTPIKKLAPILAAMSYSAKRRWRAAPEVNEDYYSVLGIQRDASQEQIAQAYRRLARECHPDAKPDDPHAKEQFIKVQAAFELLSDSAKRAQYDRVNCSFATKGKLRPTTGDGYKQLTRQQWDRRFRKCRQRVLAALIIGPIVAVPLMCFSVVLLRDVAKLERDVGYIGYGEPGHSNYEDYSALTGVAGGMSGIVAVLVIGFVFFYVVFYSAEMVAMVWWRRTRARKGCEKR